MAVKDISKENLRSMGNEEGLILQGCGGDVQEWIDGINEILTEENILLDGTRLDDVSRFENEGLTCLLFKFNDDDKINMGKLAIWRIQSHSQFGGTWLSDYVPNRLGGFTNKPLEDESMGQEMSM